MEIRNGENEVKNSAVFGKIQEKLAAQDNKTFLRERKLYYCKVYSLTLHLDLNELMKLIV